MPTTTGITRAGVSGSGPPCFLLGSSRLEIGYPGHSTVLRLGVLAE